MKEYSPEDLKKLYQALPLEMKKIVDSPEIAVKILNEARKVGIVKEEEEKKLLKIVGYVFYGLLHPDKLAKVIQEEFKISPKAAEQLDIFLNNEIFLPLKKFFDLLYQTELKKKEYLPENSKNN